MENDLVLEKKSLEKAKMGMLYWAMASMTIFFGAFCSYYLVMMGNGNWLKFELPDIFFISSITIILSSLALIYAHQSVKKNNFKGIKTGVVISFLLGLIFCYLQVDGWKWLYSQNIVFGGKYANVSGSIMYVITFLHFLHVLFGLIALLWTGINSFRNKYSAESHLGLSLAIAFWHFLDILWIVLFLFLLFNR